MKKFLILLVGMFLSINTVFATQIPSEVETYIKESFPQATVRFDGLVTLPDGTIYLPLFPSMSPKGQEFGIKLSQPQNAQISQKPDLLVFNNNFVLIKLIKQKEGYKIYFQENYPTEVVTGILPQDLLVPKGLILPDSLESILGNLVIPTTSSITYSKIATPAPVPSKNINIPFLPKEEKINQTANILKNKLFFIANSDSKAIKIVHSDKVDPSFTFRLAHVPQDIVATNDNQYLFVVSHGQTLIDVIDIKGEEIVKQIDCEVQPSALLLSDDGKKLYVASENGHAIFVIDIKEMTLSKKINVMGAPKYLVFDENYSKIYYYDKLSSNIYSLDLEAEKFVNSEIMSCPNASDIAIKGNELFVTSRTRNKLITYSLEINEVISELDLPEKPVDILLYNNFLHILCARDNQIIVVNCETGVIDKVINLSTKGFARKLNRIENSNIVLVSDVRAGFYNVYDLNTQKVIQKNKISIPITVITVVDKTGIDKL